MVDVPLGSRDSLGPYPSADAETILGKSWGKHWKPQKISAMALSSPLRSPIHCWKRVGCRSRSSSSCHQFIWKEVVDIWGT